MAYKMINKVVGINDPNGVTTRVYEFDEVIPDTEEWQRKLGERFVEAGHAIHIEPEVVVPHTKKSSYDDLPSDVEPSEKPKAKTKKSKKTFWSKK
jgi:hypothetical protein